MSGNTGAKWLGLRDAYRSSLREAVRQIITTKEHSGLTNYGGAGIGDYYGGHLARIQEAQRLLALAVELFNEAEDLRKSLLESGEFEGRL